jgi:hypothetical protein
MVQVDIFWSYAIGAGLASAASRQLAAKAKSPAEQVADSDDALLRNRFFAVTVIYLAVFFAPSGIGLLWAFPSWETMHAGDRGLPTWLVMLFAVTNITQGILGFWVTKKLYRAGKDFLASLQMVIGYFLMFFVLVYGWDGTGYRRFFSATKDAYLGWKLSNIPSFLISDVALALYGMGIILLPVLFAIMTGWIIKGKAAANEAGTGGPAATRFSVARMIVRVILGGSLVLAIIAGILIHLLGWIIGLIAFAAIAYYLALRKGGYLRSWTASMLLREPDSF